MFICVLYCRKDTATEISPGGIEIIFLGSNAKASAYGWQTYRHLGGDFLDNVGSLASHNPIDLYGCYGESFTFTGWWLTQNPVQGIQFRFIPV
jgi:hypothetical protein